MKTFVTTLSGLSIFTMPYLAFAEEAHGYSRGNAFIYFAAIATILIYGVHDVFHHKWVTWAAAVVIPVTFYFMLPEK